MIRWFLAFTVALTIALMTASAPALGHAHASAPAQDIAKRTAADARPLSAPLVNINSASVQELDGLPGIGQKMAQRIVDYRQKNGPFKRLEDLMGVQGIGEIGRAHV